MTFKQATRVATLTLQCSIVAIILVLVPMPAGAQQPDPESAGGIHLGPIELSPSVRWRTEYDDNVYRSTSQPISDLISTFGTQAGIQGRSHRVALTGTAVADWIHYSELASERGASLRTGFKVDFLFNRITPYVSTAVNSTRERVSPEIDSRPRYKQSDFAGGAVVRVGGKTSLDLSAGRSSTIYDGDAVENGVNLSEALNGTTEHVGLSMIQDVTPLTHIVLTGEVGRDQFASSTQKNSDNLRLTAGFDSDGRIKGSVRAGVRVRQPQNIDQLASRGFLLSMGTTTNVHDRVQLGLNASCDFEPSYRPEFDYYRSYGYAVSASYALRHSVKLRGTAARRYSDYSESAVSSLLADRPNVDLETSYGTGISYQLGGLMSFNVGGTYTTRKSALASRQYDGMVLTAGVSHAF